MTNNELKVKDYFQLAADYVFDRLQDNGYKRLKSGDFKKKDGDLTYEINWVNDRYNHISHQEQSCGLRILSLGARIVHKSGDWLYTFNFCAPRSLYSANFELFKTYLELDYELLDRIIWDINEVFIPATKLFKESPQALMKKLDYEPETTAPDYRYRQVLTEYLFEVFGTAEDKALFEQKKALFSSFESRAKRNCEEYLYYCLYHNNIFDMTQAEKYSTEQLHEILSVALNCIQKNDYYEYAVQSYEYIKNRVSTHQELFILTAFFILGSGAKEEIYKTIQTKMGIIFQYEK